jgi:hypothetical protein
LKSKKSSEEKKDEVWNGLEFDFEFEGKKARSSVTTSFRKIVGAVEAKTLQLKIS